MYKHNPLPFDISKYKNRNHIRKRNIVFSSPKLTQLLTTIHSLQKSKKVNSQSKEKSIHRIDSKQKPKILTPFRPDKSLEASTTHQQSYNISPSKIKTKNTSPPYYNVSTLLKNKQTVESSLQESFKKSFVLEKETKIMRISNKNKSQVTKKDTKNINFNSNALELEIKKLIEKNSWEIYEGETQNTYFHGYGSLYFENGDKFVGFFYQNFPEGHGSYYKKDVDTVVTGIWEKGELLQTF